MIICGSTHFPANDNFILEGTFKLGFGVMVMIGRKVSKKCLMQRKLPVFDKLSGQCG
jgi:hypothetical protein